MSSGILFMCAWLAVKFMVDAISIVFIYWRLIHHVHRNGGGHGGDFYFLFWISLKFPVDIIFIIVYYMNNLGGG